MGKQNLWEKINADQDSKWRNAWKKNGKKVKVGDHIFPSITRAARYLGINTPQTLNKYIKEGSYKGVSLSFVAKEDCNGN